MNLEQKVNRKERIKWNERKVKNKCPRKDPLKFYHKYWEGFTSAELYNCDRALYKALIRKDLLKEIPKNNFGNPLEYYINNYNGLTIGQVYQIEPALYIQLRNTGDSKYLPKVKDLK